MQIRGRVALVTGGAHRLGRAIGLMLAEAGAHVVIHYHTSADAAAQTAEEVRSFGVDALTVQCDVVDSAGVQTMAAQIVDHFGGVDIIVNAASLFEKTPFPAQDAAAFDAWRRVTRISIDGPFYICSALTPGMLARGGGVIVNILDLSIWRAWKRFTAHAVGKSGLYALTRQLALELAPQIRVNAVAPGLVLPPVQQSQEWIDRAAARLPLRRWGAPGDVVAAVRYLIEADFVTGEVLTVAGGEQIV